jgi:hypothetical protein
VLSIFGSVDNTKLLAFDVDTNVPTGTTVTLSAPATSGTIALTTDVIPVYARVKNVSGGSLSKGTPVYASGMVGSTSVVEVQAARSDDPAKIAIAVLAETLGVNAEGLAQVVGELTATDTGTLSLGSVWLAAAGGLTNTKPTTGTVQYLGEVTRVNSNTGIVHVNVSSPGAPAQPLDADLTSWAGVTRASGFDTFTATPSSANLAALVTDETGSGALVFASGPTFSGGTVTVTTGPVVGGLTTNPLRVVNSAGNEILRVPSAGDNNYVQLRNLSFVSGGQIAGATRISISDYVDVGNISITSTSWSFDRIGLGNATFVGWCSSTAGNTTSDTALRRSAAGVIGIDSGTSTVGRTLRSVPLTPAQITANTNNYNPGVARYYRLSTDASRNITGLSVSQVDGQECEVWNVGSFDIVLKHQDANSTAANRFICTAAADITLAADEIALLRYDSTTSRWRVRKV